VQVDQRLGYSKAKARSRMDFGQLAFDLLERFAKFAERV
jgi:hypothetical protein